ncbi:hypothetical protein BH09VER1_BH09VER1_44190 [soil metagenome]
MIATITITRRDHRDEDRDLLVDVTRDRDGDIFATCGENLDELRTTNRYGSIETHPTGRLFKRRGDPIELTDDELEEAEVALTQLETLWQSERAKLKQIFAPTTFNEPPASDSDLTKRSAKLVGVVDPNHPPLSTSHQQSIHPPLSTPLQSSVPPPPKNATTANTPNPLPTVSQNESGSGTLKNAQARSNTSSSEATQNLKSSPALVNPISTICRHDLLNSQGHNITLPPGAPHATVDQPLPVGAVDPNGPPRSTPQPPSISPPRSIPPHTSDSPLHSHFEKPPITNPPPDSPLPSAYRIPSSALAPLPTASLSKSHDAHE